MTRPITGAATTLYEHLQAGEDPRSEFVDDAVHWHDVYTALLAAAVASNLPAKAAQFTQRRDFWRQRWKSLRDRLA